MQGMWHLGKNKERKTEGRFMNKKHPYLTMVQNGRKAREKDSRVTPPKLLYQFNQCFADLIMLPAIVQKIQEEEWAC